MLHLSIVCRSNADPVEHRRIDVPAAGCYMNPWFRVASDATAGFLGEYEHETLDRFGTDSLRSPVGLGGARVRRRRLAGRHLPGAARHKHRDCLQLGPLEPGDWAGWGRLARLVDR